MDREDMINRAVEFFEGYLDNNQKAVYIEALKDFAIFGRDVVIDYSHLSGWDPELATEVLENPADAIEALNDAAVIAYANNLFEEPSKPIEVRIKNLPTTTLIKHLGPHHLNKLIQIEGTVVRVRSPEDFPVKTVFICKDCGNEMVRIQKPQRLDLYVPPRCDACGSRNLELDHEKSTWTLYQIITVQDLFENVKGGELPRQVDVILLGDLVDRVNAGDKVRITARYVHVERKTNGKAIFQKILLANYIENISEDYERIEITKEDEEKIRELSKDPEIVEKIVASIAPEIYGMEDAKKAIALALFGGVTRVLPNGTRLRGDSHILLIGDPGTAKSQLLKRAAAIAPRGHFTSGKSSSAGGLTAVAVKDEITGKWTIDAGALVLADGGVCAIDELDKMSERDRSAIHEGLEQQTISLSKAGITATLNARTTVIAAANPKKGRFDRNKLFTEQINLEPPLLSRFDLILLILDDPDPEKDALIAEHILGVRGEEKIVEPIPTPLLRKYIAFARRYIRPKPSPEAKQKLKEIYVQLRQRHKKSGSHSIPFTARQFEGLIRLAEARAKMRLSDTITAEDVEDVLDLVMRAWRTLLTDPETGEVDFTVLEIGVTSSVVNKEEKIVEIIKLLDVEGEGVPEEDIIETAREYNIPAPEVRRLLAHLREVGDITEVRRGVYKVPE